jgi:hypothetical protein
MRTPEPAWLAPEQLEARGAAEAENVPQAQDGHDCPIAAE